MTLAITNPADDPRGRPLSGLPRTALRVLHVNDLAEGGAGAETHLLGLRRWQTDQGMDVATFAAERVGPRSRSLRTWWDAREAERLRAALAEFRPDLLHAHNIAHLSPSVLAAARSAGVPAHMTVHDFRHELTPYLPGQPIPGTRWHEWLNRRKRAFVRSRIDRCCHTLFTPSRALHALTRQWAQEARVVHCPYPMAVDSREPTPPEEGAPFLFLGRLIPEKGLRTLGQAMELADARVRLVIVGDGPLAREAAGFPRTEFLGPRDRREIEGLLRTCLALVVPSEWLENYPLSILEAQANGRAVLGTSVGGIPEMVRDGEHGFLVPPFDARALADALTEMAGNPERAALMGRLGRERVRRENDPETIGRRILATYSVS